MNADHNLCDICSAPVPKIQRIWVAVERSMEPTGSYETSEDVVDLCSGCSNNAIRFLLGLKNKDVGFERNKNFIIWVNQQRSGFKKLTSD